MHLYCKLPNIGKNDFNKYVNTVLGHIHTRTSTHSSPAASTKIKLA